MQYSTISGIMTPPCSCAIAESTSSDCLMKESSFSNDVNNIRRCRFNSIRPPWLETNVDQHNHWSNVEHLWDVGDDTVEFRHELRYLLDVVVACTKYNVSFFLILVATNRRFTHSFVTSSSFFGGEQKHSHFPKLQSEKVKILTSPSIFADIGTKITVMENILHAFSLDMTEPDTHGEHTSVARCFSAFLE